MENARPYLSQSPYTYAERLDPLKEQILRVNRDNVKMNLDFGHLFMSSRFYQFDPVAAVVPVKDLVVHTHVHDNFGGVVHHWENSRPISCLLVKEIPTCPWDSGKSPSRQS